MTDLLRNRPYHLSVLFFLGLMQILLGLARQTGILPESPTGLAFQYLGVMISALFIAIHATATATASASASVTSNRSNIRSDSSPKTASEPLVATSPNPATPDPSNADPASASTRTKTYTAFSQGSRPSQHLPPQPRRSPFQIVLLLLLLLITGVQLYWGTRTALMDAGHVYNTFPTMYGQWIPSQLWIIEPWSRNFADNLVTVQWMHRLFGLLILALVLVLWAHSFRMKHRPSLLVPLSLFLLFATLLSYAAGVFTLLYHVPVVLTIVHQGSALLLVVGIGLMIGLQWAGWNMQ